MGAIKGSTFLFSLLATFLTSGFFQIGPRNVQSSPLDDETIMIFKSDNVTVIEPNKTHTNSSVMEDMVYNTSILVTSGGRNLPTCLQGCTKHLLRTLDVAVRSENNYERFINVCNRYAETLECVKNLQHCSKFELFYMLTCGLNYMCVEQEAAFNASIACIDHYATKIKDKCARTCNAEGVIAGWATYSALRGSSLFSPAMAKSPSKINVALFRKITSEGCTVIECYLSCLRTQYNEHCENSYAGSLLLEVLLRPVAKGHNSMFLGPTLNLVKLIMPEQCNFIMSTSGLSHYRIGEKLGESLKAAFGNNGNKPGLLSAMTGTKLESGQEEAVDPWQDVQSVNHQSSPLEANTLARPEPEVQENSGIPSANLNVQSVNQQGSPLAANTLVRPAPEVQEKSENPSATNHKHQSLQRLEGIRKFSELQARYGRGEVGYIPLPF